jgi:hypothetical protein
MMLRKSRAGEFVTNRHTISLLRLDRSGLIRIRFRSEVQRGQHYH